MFYPRYLDWEYGVPDGSLFMKWIWKVVFSTIASYIKKVKYISLLESFGRLLVSLLVTLLL